MIFTVFDIETTGFNKMNDEILEVGYIRCDYDDCSIIHGESLYFYKPDFVLKKEAEAIHGLTREILEPHAPEFERNIAALYTMVQDSLIAGKHSAAFDVPFVTKFLQRHAMGMQAPVPYKHVDVETLMASHFQEYSRTQLGKSTSRLGTLEEYMPVIGYTEAEVSEMFVKEFPDCQRRAKHNALYDAYMTLLVFRYLANKK